MGEYNVKGLLSNATVIVGHFGSGKTNISVNLAELCSFNSDTYLIDYDNVNPYFRAKDAEEYLKHYGISVISSDFANTNVDIPSVSPLVFSALNAAKNGAKIIFDVGGDMTGAVSLGYLHKKLEEQRPDVLYVFNAYRPITDTPEKAFEILKEIENSCNFGVTALINNSNIGAETTASDIEETDGYAQRLSELSGIPLLFTSYMTDNAPHVKGDVLKIKNRTKILF